MIVFFTEAKGKTLTDNKDSKGKKQNVAVMCLMSFFNDIASEMIYPLLPVFLSTVLGAGPAALGLIEGSAESAASLLKFYSGYLSDRIKRRKPLILFGYAVSNIVRPLIGFAAGWPMVLMLRFADRTGKGIRTAPRDSLLSSSAPAERMGFVFGLQRAMDNAGAVIGPLLAAVLLSGFAIGYRSLFLLSSIPGMVVVIMAAVVLKEIPISIPPDREHHTVTLKNALKTDPRFRRYLSALFIFYLGNSTDAFLLLRASYLGVSVIHIPILWMTFHIVKSSTCLLGGWMSDLLGRRKLIIMGWMVYSLVYFGFAMASSTVFIWILFMIYGTYFGLTEGAERALVSDLVTQESRGAAFGLFNLAVGAASLPASVMFGILWHYLGPETAFLSGAVLAVTSSMILLKSHRTNK